VTVIAANRKMMAGDSWITSEHRISQGKKIYKIPNIAVVGISGDYSDAYNFVEWVKGDNESHPPTGSYSALVLFKNGAIHCYEGKHYHPIRDPFTAIGSGAGEALAAMHCGRTPKEAVRIACKMRNDCGGKVWVARIEDI
jgi:hypothetical protein